MSKFDEAVKISLSAAQDYRQAHEDVKGLVRQIGAAVENATAKVVTIQQRRISTASLLDADREMWQLDPSTLGSDLEDHSHTWSIEARSSAGTRALWELTYSPDGYPVTITTSDSSEIRCVTREDLEDAFIGLLRQGSTGRKLQMLQEAASSKQAG